MTAETDALAPVRAELLRAARAEADARLADAHRDAAQALARARAEAEAILDQARREGQTDGAAAGAADLTRARREARTALLAAQSEIHAELTRRIITRLRERYAEDPAIPGRLAARAHALLGPDARVAVHPDGGVLAVAPGRQVDLGLPALAARALDRLGAEVAGLWEP